MVNSISVVLFIVLLAVAAFSAAMGSYYYSTLSESLKQKAENAISSFDYYRTEAEYYDNARVVVAGEPNSDKLEVEYLDADGQIRFSSSDLTAFRSPGTPDIAEAISMKRTKVWIGADPSTGEHIMAASSPLMIDGEVVGVMRYVTSLNKVDKQIIIIVAIALGIGMVHQHFMLTPVMTVAENVVIGSEPVRGVFFDRKKAEAQVAAMIDEYNFHISATAKVETLSVGEQQRVEILKALYRGADLLILDEPTAVLTPQEVEDLFRVMRQLKAAGKSIIIITHKLKETMEIADRVSVLRQGKMIESGVPVAGTTMNELAQMMVGRDVELSVTRRAEQVGEENFSVRGLSLTERGVPILRDVCLSLRKGEILGIAGIEGNGQTELIEVLTGLRRPDHMELFKDGKPLSGNAAAFLAAGVGHVPEDRMTRGLVLEMSIEDNLILGYHRRPALRLASAIRRFAEQERTEFAIKAPNVQERCSALSGGNQQKVVIARVFSENPDVIIVAQPTRGVDVGAMEYIHHRLLDLRDGGKSILLISADLDEVRSLSDRLAVIYGGRIVAEGKPDTWSDMEIGLLMTGGSLAPEKEGTA